MFCSRSLICENIKIQFLCYPNLLEILTNFVVLCEPKIGISLMATFTRSCYGSTIFHSRVLSFDESYCIHEFTPKAAAAPLPPHASPPPLPAAALDPGPRPSRPMTIHKRFISCLEGVSKSNQITTLSFLFRFNRLLLINSFSCLFQERFFLI